MSDTIKIGSPVIASPKAPLGLNSDRVPAPDDSVLTIDTVHGLHVDIHYDGTIVFGPGYEPDEVAKTFWRAIGHHLGWLKFTDDDIDWVEQAQMVVEVEQGDEVAEPGNKVLARMRCLSLDGSGSMLT